MIEKNELELLIKKDISTKEIAKKFKVNVETIRRYAKKYDLLLNKKSYYNDLSNQKFDKITVIKPVGTTKDRNKIWLCECDCGTKGLKFNTSQLKNNKNLKCKECIKKEKLLKMPESKTRLYNTWQHMKSRCYNKNNKNYNIYGERGITICDEWVNSFEKFKIWAINNGYKKELTIDRIDCNGNYSPENCRWITIEKQQNNRRNNKNITFNNVTLTLSEWCKELNLNYSTINSRINVSKCEPLIALGLTGNFKAKDENYFIWKGKEKSYSEWCKITGEKLYNGYNRIYNMNWSIEKALGLI